jgi:hypothetical protein
MEGSARAGSKGAAGKRDARLGTGAVARRVATGDRDGRTELCGRAWRGTLQGSCTAPTSKQNAAHHQAPVDLQGRVGVRGQGSHEGAPSAPRAAAADLPCVCSCTRGAAAMPHATHLGVRRQRELWGEGRLWRLALQGPVEAGGGHQQRANHDKGQGHVPAGTNHDSSAHITTKARYAALQAPIMTEAHRSQQRPGAGPDRHHTRAACPPPLSHRACSPQAQGAASRGGRVRAGRRAGRCSEAGAPRAVPRRRCARHHSLTRPGAVPTGRPPPWSAAPCR